MKIVIRADASQTIGGGHVMRCMTLADTLTRQGAKCVFALRPGSLETVPVLAKRQHQIIILERAEREEVEEIESSIGVCDWLIVDHYGRDENFETAARNFAKKIMVIDDLADRHHDCDILLDQTFGREAEDYKSLVPASALILTGTNYALLRPEFARKRPQALVRRENSETIRRILVSLGASNPHGIINKILKAISQLDPEIIVDMVIGTGDPQNLGLSEIAETMPQQVNFHGFDVDMADLMVRADLAIGAGGSTSWERCCLGLPTLMIVIADNQKTIAAELAAKGAVRLMGNIADLDTDDISGAISELANDESLRHKMSFNASKICAGLGAARTASMLMPPVTAKDGSIVELRGANIDDADWLLKLQLKPQTRRFFRNPDPPTKKQHISWLTGRLNDPASQLHIITLSGQSQGYIRVDYLAETSAHEISIAIDPVIHGKGIGSIALRLIRDLMPDVVFTAEVAEENAASQKLFLSAGFVQKDNSIYISRPK